MAFNYYPGYPTTYSGMYPNYPANGYSQAPAPAPQPVVQQEPYMINVDGEVGARAWQMPGNLQPNTVIPLWDVDGQHVYFRSVDAYGRMNPLRKARVVFEEEKPALPQGMSGEMGNFVTKDDLAELKNEIRQMMQNQNRQNGSRPAQPQARGGNEG